MTILAVIVPLWINVPTPATVRLSYRYIAVFSLACILLKAPQSAPYSILVGFCTRGPYEIVVSEHSGDKCVRRNGIDNHGLALAGERYQGALNPSEAIKFIHPGKAPGLSASSASNTQSESPPGKEERSLMYTMPLISTQSPEP